MAEAEEPDFTPNSATDYLVTLGNSLIPTGLQCICLWRGE